MTLVTSENPRRLRTGAIGVQHTIGDIAARIREVRRVGQVERFCAELQLESLRVFGTGGTG